MSDSVQRFIARLATLRPSDSEPEYMQVLYRLVEELGDDADVAVVPHVFAYFERWTDAHHGNPGPLVHLIEKPEFDVVFAQELLASLRRRPVPHTIWLLNRQINAVRDPRRRAELMDLLVGIASHPQASDSAREQAADLVKFQLGLSS